MAANRPPFYKHHLLILVAFIAANIIVSCSRSQQQAQILSIAESLSYDYPDSALTILDEIESSELTVDSLKAKYHLIKASIHDNQGHLMLSDSSIRYSADYYRDKDMNRAVRSATLSALYDYWVKGDRNAIGQLDSLANIDNLPDSIAIFTLRKRAYWSTKLFDEDGNRPIIKRLISIDNDSSWQELYQFWLHLDYLFDNQTDSSLIILNKLIDKAILDRSDSKQFDYEYEKIGILEELGRYQESLELADKFLEKAHGNSLEHYIHMWKSLNLFNMGKRDQAIKELAKADSCAAMISESEKGYYNSFAYVLSTVFEYHNTGRIRLIPIAEINNRQKDNLFRTQYLQQESEQNALKIENKRLSLKAKSDRQMAIIIIIILAGLLISGLSIWFALDRKRKTIEAEERTETLQKMVEELKTSTAPTIGQESLRRIMLRQLGIIKMVAEAPTEQNREMLRKISSVDRNSNGPLVNWENVFEMIDSLYSGFYSRLHELYGSVLSEKEEQIIVLMIAGFSTKETGVITSQSAATIYVRKSSIRKKLGIPEKEDIMAFLRQSIPY
ncbi:hypothetical protein E4T81_13920 [Barnesiella sp. WM24]|uniref:helix-turn-helix transcriptional regulator n=1 Tax=Barnesiella sp. WM24 TaxID=2558278 RepID=UPI001072B5D0|nr:LuxR C-terminal-related transcriptional regulator [Barnesiella sp. WM24]TFU91876.1 hypothetical protein E4T81_13920 [Barnesiella sp. WM24]